MKFCCRLSVLRFQMKLIKNKNILRKKKTIKKSLWPIRKFQKDFKAHKCPKDFEAQAEFLSSPTPSTLLPN